MKMAKYWMALLLLSVLVLFPGCGKTEEPPVTAPPTEATEPKPQLREGITTLLVACFDDHEAAGFQNGDRADFIMLLVIDELQGTTEALQINSDCMVSYKPLGKSEPEQMPLGLVYTYGSGGSDSHIDGAEAVSQLLGDVPIHHYMTFSKESLPIVNDMLGGVEVLVTEDFAKAYPEYPAGERVNLQGEAAQDYFFYRETTDVDKAAQMKRQHQYMKGMFGPFLAATQQEDFLSSLVLGLGEGFVTDMTLSQMVPMLELLEGYELDEVVATLPGTAEMQDGQFQFHPDPQGLKEIVEDLFC